MQVSKKRRSKYIHVWSSCDGRKMRGGTITRCSCEIFSMMKKLNSKYQHKLLHFTKYDLVLNISKQTLNITIFTGDDKMDIVV